MLSLLESFVYPNTCLHLDVKCRMLQRNKTALCLSNSILSCLTAFQNLLFIWARQLWLLEPSNLIEFKLAETLVLFPALRLGNYLKSASNLQLFKVITWRVLAKFLCKIVFIAFNVITLFSPKARYFPLKSSIYFRHKKKK